MMKILTSAQKMAVRHQCENPNLMTSVCSPLCHLCTQAGNKGKTSDTQTPLETTSGDGGRHHPHERIHFARGVRTVCPVSHKHQRHTLQVSLSVSVHTQR